MEIFFGYTTAHNKLITKPIATNGKSLPQTHRRREERERERMRQSEKKKKRERKKKKREKEERRKGA